MVSINEEFRRDLQSVINKYSKENDSGTPDFILAEFLEGVLELYNNTLNKRGVFRDEPTEFKPVVTSPTEETSPYRKAMDDILDNQLKNKETIVEYLMADPGILSTFGSDFVMIQGDMEISMGDLRFDDKLEVTFRQKVSFYERENPYGDLESV